MSAKPIPEMRLEMFRKPKLFSDNWVKNPWTPYQATQASDGDYNTVTIAGGYAAGLIYKTFSPALNSTIQRYIAVRNISFNTFFWRVEILLSGVSKATWNYTTIGLKTIDITSKYSGDYDQVYLYGEGTAGQTMVFDYFAILEDTLLVPTETFDIESATLDRPILQMGVANLEVFLDNSDGAYTGKINDLDILLFWLNEKGASMKKMFGGRILQPGGEGWGNKKKYHTVIQAYSFGQELQAPPSLVKRYDTTAKNARVIVNEDIDLCNEVTKKFVDDENGDGIPDEDMASTHMLENNQVTPYDEINQVCGLSKTLGGFIGADGYIDPAANVHIFKRGKFTSSVTPIIRHYNHKKDDLRIRNKTGVYGAAEKSNPSDKDVWTEQIGSEPVTDKWSADTGTSLSWETSIVYRGNESVKAVTAEYYVTSISHTLDTPISCKFNHDFKELKFAYRITSPNFDHLQIILYDDQLSSSHRWQTGWLPTKPMGDFDFKILGIGPEHEGSIWTKFGSPDWAKVKRVEFKGNNQAGTKTIIIDNVHFDKARFYGEWSDSVSISKYGTRWQAPETDDSLKSDADCETRAKGIVEFLKDPVINLMMECDGDNGYREGDLLTVNLPKENVNDAFRTLRIKDIIKGVDWQNHLTISNEPTKIDYLFALLFKDLKRLGKGTAVPGAGASYERPHGIRVGKPGQEPYDFETIQEAIDAL